MPLVHGASSVPGPEKKKKKKPPDYSLCRKEELLATHTVDKLEAKKPTGRWLCGLSVELLRSLLLPRRKTEKRALGSHRKACFPEHPVAPEPLTTSCQISKEGRKQVLSEIGAGDHPAQRGLDALRWPVSLRRTPPVEAVADHVVSRGLNSMRIDGCICWDVRDPSSICSSPFCPSS